jgi:glutaredoxin
MFTVYSKPACPWCDQAKALLKSQGHEFDVVNLDVGQPQVESETYISREAMIAKFPGVRTMPQITYQDANSARHLGGYQELQSFLRQAA